MDYVTVGTYFSDLAIIDERLKRLEHLMDVLTKEKVEELLYKKTDKSKNNRK